ncbi:MAG: aspartate aminotransferase family protein [Alphaproteobacteria bacterium]
MTVRFPDPNSRSAALFERAKKVFPGGSTRGQTFMRPYLIYAREAKGCRITDVDGVERIDFVNNFTTQLHGHGHPAIVEAIQTQAAKGTGFNFATELEIELAELIVPRAASFEQIRFCNTGTEAVMHAIKAARAVTGRSKIAKCEGVYHGAYDYAEVSLDPDPQHWGRDAPASVGFAKAAPEGMLQDVVAVPFNDLEGTRRILDRHQGELAAFLLDAVPSRCGGVPVTPEYVALVRDYTRKGGALFILDEIVTFRLDHGGAQTLCGIEPDITTLGKVIGGGLAVGALAGRAGAMAAFDQTKGKAPVPQSGTFTANPLTMAAGVASMTLTTREALARLNALGEEAREVVRGAFRAAGVSAQVLGEGSLIVITFAKEKPETYRDVYRANAAGGAQAMEELWRRLLNHGVFWSTTGLGCLSTPMGDAEIERLGEAMYASLGEMKADGLERLFP